MGKALTKSSYSQLVSTKSAVKNKQNWFVYIILADDDSLYTGITNNLEKRFKAHTEKKGAKYFYARKPVKIVYQEGNHNRSSASKREYEIKQLTRTQKLSLIQSNLVVKK